MSDHAKDHGTHPRLDELRARIATGEVDTLMVAFTDMQGRLMGKRVTAEAFLDGVYYCGAGQYMDLRTVQRHRSPKASSRAVYKGAVAGGGRTIFQGLIEVAKASPAAFRCAPGDSFMPATCRSISTFSRFSTWSQSTPFAALVAATTLGSSSLAPLSIH